MDVREESTKVMPFKFDAAGNIVLQEVNGKKLPVFITGDKEAPFDADATVETIGRLNGEAKTNREAKEAAEKLIKGFTDAGITDATKAAEALKLVANIDAKKLVDAGEIEKVRSEISKGFQTQIDELTGKLKTSEQVYQTERIGSEFARSKYITEKLAIPADMVQARFGNNVVLEGGKLFLKDNSGNKLYSRTKPGELADFEEGLPMLIEAYPYKDSILKGAGGNGGGSQNGGNQGAGGKKTLTRSQFEALDPVARSTAMKEGASVVD